MPGRLCLGFSSSISNSAPRGKLSEISGKLQIIKGGYMQEIIDCAIYARVSIEHQAEVRCQTQSRVHIGRLPLSEGFGHKASQIIPRTMGLSSFC